MYKLILSLVCAFNALPAAARGPGADSTRCYTHYGSSSTACKTTWTTHYTRCTITTSTIKTVTTVAPVPTVTSTVTSVFTVRTGTLTIPAPSNFLPIQSTLPGSSYDGRYSVPPFRRRDGARNLVIRGLPDLKSRFLKPGMKPKAVECHRWTHEKCITTTQTLTVTSTIVPTGSPVVVTRTVNTTTTLSSTTFYAACATNNIADRYRDNPLAIDLRNYDPDGVLSTVALTTYGCCVAAFTLPPSTGIPTFWGSLFGSDPDCMVSYQTTCPGGQNEYQFFCENGTDNGSSGGAVGNTVCGEFIPVSG